MMTGSATGTASIRSAAAGGAVAATTTRRRQQRRPRIRRPCRVLGTSNRVGNSNCVSASIAVLVVLVVITMVAATAAAAHVDEAPLLRGQRRQRHSRRRQLVYQNAGLGDSWHQVWATTGTQAAQVHATAANGGGVTVDDKCVKYKKAKKSKQWRRQLETISDDGRDDHRRLKKKAKKTKHFLPYCDDETIHIEGSGGSYDGDGESLPPPPPRPTAPVAMPAPVVAPTYPSPPVMAPIVVPTVPAPPNVPVVPTRDACASEVIGGGGDGGSNNGDILLEVPIDGNANWTAIFASLGGVFGDLALESWQNCIDEAAGGRQLQSSGIFRVVFGKPEGLTVEQCGQSQCVTALVGTTLYYWGNNPELFVQRVEEAIANGDFSGIEGLQSINGVPVNSPTSPAPIAPPPPTEPAPVGPPPTDPAPVSLPPTEPVPVAPPPTEPAPVSPPPTEPVPVAPPPTEPAPVSPPPTEPAPVAPVPTAIMPVEPYPTVTVGRPPTAAPMGPPLTQPAPVGLPATPAPVINVGGPVATAPQPIVPAPVEPPSDSGTPETPSSGGGGDTPFTFAPTEPNGAPTTQSPNGGNNNNGGDGASGVTRGETNTAAPSSIGAGSIVGITAAGLIVALALLAMGRRRRWQPPRHADDDVHRAFKAPMPTADEDDDVLDAGSSAGGDVREVGSGGNSLDDSYFRDDVDVGSHGIEVGAAGALTGAPRRASKPTPPVPTRLAHVVGEEDSIYSGNTFESQSAAAPPRQVPMDEDGVMSNYALADESSMLDPYLHGDDEFDSNAPHMCSSPNCVHCEQQRQQGVQFTTQRAAPRGPPRASDTLPVVQGDRNYLARDTVDL